MSSCCPCTVLKVSGGTTKIAVSAVIEVGSKQFEYFYLVLIAGNGQKPGWGLKSWAPQGAYGFDSRPRH